MDRRTARREVCAKLAAMEVDRDRLDEIASNADSAGDPILATELRRYTEKMTAILDLMYEWVGKI
ncbi:hypothetical protein LCGC14_2650150 [marine sediment metagenome]|uniref:Uncharacterized protein n=1 Tax=marine sediment metagenome TaxID=412755 RepID=A0A0F9AHB7_9ZZZZ